MVEIFHKGKKYEFFGEQSDYIDLNSYDFRSDESTDSKHVIVAEIEKYDDMGAITKEIYDENVVVIDYSAIADDDLLLKRVISDLKKITKEIGGDVAGIHKNLLMVTNPSLKIKREKLITSD